MKIALVAVAVLVVVISGVGCGSEKKDACDGNGASASFSMAITDGPVESLSYGCGYVSPYDDTIYAETTFVFSADGQPALGEEQSAELTADGFLETGTFAINDTGTNLTAFAVFPIDGPLWMATAGTITVTEVSETTATGTFSFPGLQTVSGDPVSSTVTGTFSIP